MAYATPADLIKRYDVRTIGDLAGDTGERVLADDVATDANVLELLDDASGEIDAALLVGGMYSPADLTGLAGANAKKLVRLTCDIATLYLFERRPAYDPDRTEVLRERYKQSLTDLRKGENVFNISDNIAAGKPSIDGPTTADYDRLNLLPDRVRNYYPRRGGRLPTNRQ